MQKEDLQRIYNQEKAKENELAKNINDCEKNLNILKLSNHNYRIKTNLFISLIILLGLSRSSLFFVVAESKILSEVILTLLFGGIYLISDFTYRFVVSKKYGINLFKKVPEKERINKEIEYSIKLEKIKNEDNIVKKSLSYLSNKIKECYNGLPLFSKNYYLGKNELETKMNNLNESVQEKSLKLKQNVEEYALNKVSRNYSLINIFLHTILNICIGTGLIVTLPLLLNLTISGLFQIILGFILFSGYATCGNTTFNNARDAFNDYGINLVSLKYLGNTPKNLEKIKEESEFLSKCKIEQMEVKMVKSLITNDPYESKEVKLMPKTIEIIPKKIESPKGKILIKK